jgi:hypothetical protein
MQNWGMWADVNKVSTTLGAVFKASSPFLSANNSTILFSSAPGTLPKNSATNFWLVSTLFNRSGCRSMLVRIKCKACASGCHRPPPVECHKSIQLYSAGIARVSNLKRATTRSSSARKALALAAKWDGPGHKPASD